MWPGSSLVTDSVCNFDVHFWNFRTASLCRWYSYVGFIRLWPSAHTGAFYSGMWNGRDESQHLQAWRLDSLKENSWSLPPGWAWVIASRNGIQEVVVTVKWSVRSVVDWCGVISNASVLPDLCAEEGEELDGRAYNIPVDPCFSRDELWVVIKRFRLWITLLLHIERSQLSEPTNPFCWSYGKWNHTLYKSCYTWF